MWWALAAAALPYVMSGFQHQPDQPGRPKYGALPDRSRYINDMLDDAYNPNSNTFNLASDRAVDQVNRILGRTGMSGSTVGNQAHALTQAELATKWLENVSQRKQQALKTVNDYDMQRAGYDRDVASAQYQYDMDQYNQANQRNANQIQGISNMVGAGMQGYYQDQTQKRYDQQMAQNQAMIDAMTRPSYGVPGYNYSGPAYQMMPAANSDRYNVGNS